MGLDITAYRGIALIDCVFNEDGDPIDPKSREPIEYDLVAYINSDFPGRSADLVHKGVYSAKDRFGFRAGSYGGYNGWRDALAKLAGYPIATYQQYGRDYQIYSASAWDKDSVPFWELINFSDCEGIIGAVVSAKLAKDFAEFSEKAKAHEDQSFRERYELWSKAFEMASDNGAVDFH